MIPLFDTKSISKLSFWVIIIISINIYIFILELTSPDIEAFIVQYALIPSEINFGKLSTLSPFITSQFLHGGFLHIISNMLFLWVFGKNVEAKIGFLFFPFLYLLSGALGGLAQYLVNPTLNVPMLGASGAIAGILGSYFVFFPDHKIKTLVFIFIFVTILEIPAWILLFYWFITQVLAVSFTISSTVSQGGIAYIAHVIGFITGWIITATFYVKPQALSFRRTGVI